MNNSEIEKKKYETMWEFDSYRERSPGMRFIDNCLEVMNPTEGSSFIDLGCGTGRVSKYLSEKGFKVTALDIAKNACKEFDGEFIESCIWEIPDSVGKYNYGVCFDVMEHLPTENINQTLECLSKHADRIYFQIANFVCHEGDKIGESLHLTVKSIDWWYDVISKYFEIEYSKADAKHHLFLVKSK